MALQAAEHIERDKHFVKNEKQLLKLLALVLKTYVLYNTAYLIATEKVWEDRCSTIPFALEANWGFIEGFTSNQGGVP